MSMNDLRTAIDVVKAHPDRGHFLGPRPEALVAKAEAALGLKFPPTYRTFLLELGCGSFAGREFYGVADDDFAPVVPDAIGLTMKHRQRWELPPQLLVIGELGEGTMFALDTSRATGEECEVVSMYLGEAPSYEAGDFGQFMRERVEAAMAQPDLQTDDL